MSPNSPSPKRGRGEPTGLRTSPGSALSVPWRAAQTQHVLSQCGHGPTDTRGATSAAAQASSIRPHPKQCPQFQHPAGTQQDLAVPKESQPLLLSSHPSDVAAQSLGRLECSLNIHSLRAVGADSRVNTKRQLSPWAWQWHRGTESCSLSPPAPDCGAEPTTNTTNIPSPSP